MSPIATIDPAAGEREQTSDLGIFRNDVIIAHLLDLTLLEQNDESAVRRARYMTPETVSQLSDDLLTRLPEMAN